MPFIQDLDPNAPDPNDVAGVTDDELRALKATLQDQFTGNGPDPYDIPIVVGPRALNAVEAKADQADLDATNANVATNTTNIGLNAAAIAANTIVIDAIVADYTTAQEAFDLAWPVGSMWISADGGSPASKGMLGTWGVVGDGRVLLGDPITGGTGGANSVTLTAAQMAPHKHTHVTPRHQSGISGDVPSYADSNPARSFNQMRQGTNSPNNQYAEWNTDEGIGVSAAPVDITPAHLTVRFYQRTA